MYTNIIYTTQLLQYYMDNINIQYIILTHTTGLI